ncbi:hypothetical protein CYMTET_26776 [Cymbomonas tetramitiformis]|uniref:Uncharacterized protein n=1 Tax=Cymbomonas tetramitiformis TaxID=36881 RepID=A0AAE0FRE0_9CHLO|nr:hypothetical protein CYMTET_26776 [Cymbomonas tetramitiformis]
MRLVSLRRFPELPILSPGPSHTARWQSGTCIREQSRVKDASTVFQALSARAGIPPNKDASTAVFKVVWNLSDINGDGALDPDEFCIFIAMNKLYTQCGRLPTSMSSAQAAFLLGTTPAAPQPTWGPRLHQAAPSIAISSAPPSTTGSAEVQQAEANSSDIPTASTSIPKPTPTPTPTIAPSEQAAAPAPHLAGTREQRAGADHPSDTDSDRDNPDLEQLVQMGFARDLAWEAVVTFPGDLEQAAEWLLGLGEKAFLPSSDTRGPGDSSQTQVPSASESAPTSAPSRSLSEAGSSVSGSQPPTPSGPSGAGAALAALPPRAEAAMASAAASAGGAWGISIEKVGLKDTKPLVDPFFMISVLDAQGGTIEAAQNTGIAVQMVARYIIVNQTIYIQTPKAALPPDSAIFFQLKHFKAKEKKMSVKFWAFATPQMLTSGSVNLPLYKKPVDPKRKKLSRFNSKSLDLFLKVH